MTMKRSAARIAQRRLHTPLSRGAASATGGNIQYCIKTYNAISAVGLKRFPTELYQVSPEADEPFAIMLRSHPLKDEEVGPTVRAIARCGAGTNNVPVARMTERGIPVFNSPGANANAVKELSVCALLLASRGIAQSISAVSDMLEVEEDPAVIKKRVEAEKKKFGGQEIKGKTLGVIGLGHIGASLAEAALDLGMNIVAYDPAISLEAAWRLPGQSIDRVLRLEDLLSQSDYISLHVPYIPDKTHHLLDLPALQCLKPSCNIINFARGELIDVDALAGLYENGDFYGTYVGDFPTKVLAGNPRCLFLPHLGASTEEAEENSAAMAADEVRDFLEHGIIRNSVNFPETTLPRRGNSVRLVIVNENVPGVLGAVTTMLGEAELNILQTVNTSRGDIAYNVVDLEAMPADADALQEALFQVEGVISSRILSGLPRTHFRSKY